MALQGKGQENSNVIIKVYRNEQVDTLSQIKAITIDGIDTTINLHVTGRYVKKIALTNLTHTLNIIIEKDTITFSFLEISEYISSKSPVSEWELRIFDDMNLAKQIYNYKTKNTIVTTVQPNTEMLYVFSCNFCTIDTFSTIEVK
jgi:hypothetical protein